MDHFMCVTMPESRRPAPWHGSLAARLMRVGLSLALAAQMALLPALAGAQSPGGGATPLDTIAVLDLEPVGASEIEASAISDRLREELVRTGAFTVVDRSQIKAILDEQALQQAGCTTQECAVQVGQMLGVRKIVSGRVTKIDEGHWLVSAQMIDVETSKTLRAESLRFQGSYFSLMDTTIGNLANSLAGREAAPLAAPPVVAAEKSGGIAWYWWVLGGVVLLGAAAAAGGGSKPGTSATGDVSYTW